MFRNYINKHDLLDGLKKGGKLFSVLSRKISSSNQERVKNTWAITDYPAANWWDIPEVQQRWNKFISGNENVEYYEYVSQKYFGNRNNLIGLSLGCGTGHRELKWVEQNKFSILEAVDISQPRIETAKKEALSRGYDNIIKYVTADIYKINMKELHYDAIFAEQSLHHFSPLKKLLLKINSSLKPDGYFIINEFVGPTRFQWTEKQIEVINGLLSIIPVKYKKLYDNNDIKNFIYRPSKLRMVLGDPSEAIESGSIMQYLNEIFDVVEVRPYGGTILNLLFAGIGHHFLSPKPKIQRWLKMIFEIEDLLVDEDEIESDFVIAICKKRK
jgi:ubiquinone/menaquinone biosynthesis C-methylase UbiE